MSCEICTALFTKDCPHRNDYNRIKPRGPNDQKKLISIKIFNLDQNFWSRSKILISMSRSPPQKIGLRWVARSKISFSIEIFNLDRNLDFFWSLGPLGIPRSPRSPILPAGYPNPPGRVTESSRPGTRTKMFMFLGFRTQHINFWPRATSRETPGHPVGRPLATRSGDPPPPGQSLEREGGPKPFLGRGFMVCFPLP